MKASSCLAVRAASLAVAAAQVVEVQARQARQARRWVVQVGQHGQAWRLELGVLVLGPPSVAAVAVAAAAWQAAASAAARAPYVRVFNPFCFKMLQGLMRLFYNVA